MRGWWLVVQVKSKMPRAISAFEKMPQNSDAHVAHLFQES